MESSPLIKAHDHARAASTATHTSDTTVAINEHTRAAGEFANAAKDTTSVEALRTLKLLEQHHLRLSELLQAPFQPHSSQVPTDNDSLEDEKNEAHSSSDHATGSSKTLNEKSAQPKQALLKQPKYPARDLGASIASNLASARGIRSKYRSQPLIPSVSNTEVPGNMEGTSKKFRSRSRMHDMLNNSDRTNAISGSDQTARIVEDAPSSRNSDGVTPSSDEGFSRFYSAFGSIINKISAPLAFAGLPLISEEQPEEQTPPPPPEMPTQKRIRVRHSTSASTEPDLQKLYSKAALRAVVREGQSANDSFYVVPTSGHTASYASILSFADKEKRRMESIHVAPGNHTADPDEDDFVDARESQITHSSALRRRAGKGSTDNMLEELYLENKGLKDMIDLLSKRLHAFESMSQSSGMRLAESMRLMGPGSPLSPATKPVGSEEALAREVGELKLQNQALMKRNEELERGFNKANANLSRYREKWDQLKAGAKARRAGSAQSNSEMTEEALKSPNLG
ncbi:hypothetical protein GGR50DRAFT_646756 [Xylaria sp. CBS 124048]|nr:hypothetical protein GGR50DRAFT_646756 [Xylaria sp. CBS 124048]